MHRHGLQCYKVLSQTLGSWCRLQLDLRLLDLLLLDLLLLDLLLLDLLLQQTQVSEGTSSERMDKIARETAGTRFWHHHPLVDWLDRSTHLRAPKGYKDHSPSQLGNHRRPSELPSDPRLLDLRLLDLRLLDLRLLDLR